MARKRRLTDVADEEANIVATKRKLADTADAKGEDFVSYLRDWVLSKDDSLVSTSFWK